MWLLGNGVVSIVYTWPKTKASSSVGLQQQTHFSQAIFAEQISTAIESTVSSLTSKAWKHTLLDNFDFF